jgi:hypothetical protein
MYTGCPVYVHLLAAQCEPFVHCMSVVHAFEVMT